MNTQTLSRTKTNKKWYYKNREDILLRRKQRYNSKEEKKRQEKIKPWVRSYYYAKNRCKHSSYYKNIECKISKEEILELWIRDRAYLMEKPSLDRIMSNKDYIKENCQFIEMRDNASKAQTERWNSAKSK